MEETSGGVIEGSGGTLEATAAVEAEQAMTKTTSKKNELKSSSQVLL